MKRYLGVDLHRTQFVVCTRWENGEQEIRQWRIGELGRSTWIRMLLAFST